MATFGMAPQTLLAPLGAMTLVWNTLIAPCMLGEALTRRALLATLLIILGATLAVAFSSHATPEYVIPDDDDDAESELISIRALWARPIMIVYEIFVCSGILALYVLVMRHQREVGAAGHDRDRKVSAASSISAEMSDARGPASATATVAAPSRRSGGDAAARHTWSGTTVGRIATRLGKFKIGKVSSALSIDGRLPVCALVITSDALQGIPSTKGRRMLRRQSSSGRLETAQEFAGIVAGAATVAPADGGGAGGGGKAGADSVAGGGWRNAMEPLSYATLAGSIGGQSVMLAKTIVELIKTTASGADNAFAHADTWVMIVFLFVGLFNQARFLNAGLQHFDALVIVPMYQCIWMFCNILGGAIAFDELKNFSTMQAIFFPVGSLLTWVGIAVLARSSSQDVHDTGAAAIAAAEAAAVRVEPPATTGVFAPSAEAQLEAVQRAAAMAHAQKKVFDKRMTTCASVSRGLIAVEHSAIHGAVYQRCVRRASAVGEAVMTGRLVHDLGTGGFIAQRGHAARVKARPGVLY